MALGRIFGRSGLRRDIDFFPSIRHDIVRHTERITKLGIEGSSGTNYNWESAVAKEEEQRSGAPESD